MASKTIAEVAPPKAGFPVAISKSTTPNEKRSLRRSSNSPRACSGDMYATVPRVDPGLVRSSLAAVTMFDLAPSSCCEASLGEPKVEHLGLAGACDEDVRRLDVAVHDVLGVCGIQCFGDLDSEFQNDVDLQQRSVEPTPKCLALEQLHHDEGLALVLIDLVDRADVRMVQGCRGAGFPKKAAKRGLVARRPREEGT